MRVLITNHALANLTGSELYVRDLALGLLAAGHTPIAYSTRLGKLAEEIRGATVPVIDNLAQLATPPDIIHGQHHLETMSAMMHFPGVPGIFVCHGWKPWEEMPPRFPRILRYVAVDEPCYDRLVCERGISPERVRLLLNFVDLDRFKPRDALPEQPKRALMLSNNEDEVGALDVLREACRQAGITLDVKGRIAGEVCEHPESVLRDYDIVFAKARSALEALAVGAAVITFDAIGAGQMITTSNLAQLRSLNFGIRHLNRPVTSTTLSGELARYDPHDAAQVSKAIRASAGRDLILGEFLSLYQDVIDEYRQMANHDGPAEFRAAADYLRELTPEFRALGDKAGQFDGVKDLLSFRAFSRYSRIKSNFRKKKKRQDPPVK